MDLFGGEVVPYGQVEARIKEFAKGRTGLKDVALLLKVPSYHTSYQSVLLFDRDASIKGDWLIDPDQSWLKKNKICMVVCFGNFTVERDIINDCDKFWPLLFVSGDLKACNVIKGGMPVIVGGSLKASGYVVGEYNDGPIRVGGDLSALGYVPMCKDRKEGRGHVVAGRIMAPVFDARNEFSSEELHATFVEDVLVYCWFSRPSLLEYGHAGRSIWRPQAEREAILNRERPQPVVLTPPVLSPVDPVSLGVLRRANEVKDELCHLIAERIVHDPERYSYPASFADYVRYQLEEYPDRNVLVLPAGTRLAGDLQLDWDIDWVRKNKIVGIATTGALAVEGDILNRTLEGGPLLFVGGSLSARNLIKGGAPVILLGDVVADGVVIGEYNDGVMRVGGNLTAAAFLLFDHDGFVRGTVNCQAYSDDDGEWRDVLADHLFDSEDDYHPSVDRVWACQRAGMPIFR